MTLRKDYLKYIMQVKNSKNMTVFDNECEPILVFYLGYVLQNLENGCKTAE